MRLEEIPLILHVPGLGVHARGTRVMLEVVSIDELTVEASCRLLNVIDAPGAAVEEDEAEEEIIESDDLSAESEAEAQAEASTETQPETPENPQEPTP